MTTTRSNISTQFRPTTRLTGLEIDILEFIWSKVNPINPFFEKVTFDVKEFFKVTGKKYHDYNIIRKALRHIRKTEIVIKDIKYGSWLSFVIADPNESFFTVHIDPEAKLHLIDLQGEYVKYQSDMIFKFKSSYTKFFYPFLKSLAGKKHKKYKMTISDFKDQVRIDQSKYKNYTDFRRFALDVVMNELKDKADVYFTYEAKKKNRSYHFLTLTIHRRKMTKKQEDMVMNPENPVVEFMQKRYGFSEKAIANILNLIPEDKDITENLEAANDFITKKQKNKEKVDPAGVIKASIKGDWKKNTKPPKKQDNKDIKPPTKQSIENTKERKEQLKQLDKLKTDKKYFDDFIDYVSRFDKTLSKRLKENLDSTMLSKEFEVLNYLNKFEKTYYTDWLNDF